MVFLRVHPNCWILWLWNQEKFENINLPFTMGDSAKSGGGLLKNGYARSDEFASSHCFIGRTVKKKEAWEKSLPKMSIRQPVPRWSGISWMEAKQGAGEWTLQPMKLIKTLFIHLKVNFQYDWAANTLIPNLKVCETKTWSKYKQRANPLIKSSSAAAPGEDDLFY